MTNSKISQQPPTFLHVAQVPQGIKSAVLGKELNVEMPLHSYFVCVCVCVCLNGILLFKKKKAVEEEAPFTIVNIAKPWGVIHSLLCDPEPSRIKLQGVLFEFHDFFLFFKVV